MSERERKTRRVAEWLGAATAAIFVLGTGYGLLIAHVRSSTAGIVLCGALVAVGIIYAAIFAHRATRPHKADTSK